jgi:hypothetical protein
MPIIQKAEIRRIEVQSQTQQIVHETLSQKNPSQKKGQWSDSMVEPISKIPNTKTGLVE